MSAAWEALPLGCSEPLRRVLVLFCRYGTVARQLARWAEWWTREKSRSGCAVSSSYKYSGRQGVTIKVLCVSFQRGSLSVFSRKMYFSSSPLGVALASTFLAAVTQAQTYQRFGTCPTLGCVIPPDQQDFLAGQYFDIRVEVHAPVNGSEATNGVPDEDFTLTIGKAGARAATVSEYFESEEPELETWDFSYYE